MELKEAKGDHNISNKNQKKFEKLFTTTADEAAAVIIRGVEKNDRRVLIGKDAVAIDLMVRFFPSAYQKLVSMSSKRMH